jgi:hypothetical protein
VYQSAYSFALYTFNTTNVIGSIERTGKTSNVPADTIAYFESGFDIEARTNETAFWYA